MEEIPPIAAGFVRIAVRLPKGSAYTPGDLASRAGIEIDSVGLITVVDLEALIDVRAERGKVARIALERLGPTRLEGWTWQWLRLGLGRNHGLTIGQLKRIMQTADAMPLGRIHIQNTHSLVGLQDFKMPAVLARLQPLRVNGFASRAEALPPGSGPGNAAYLGSGSQHS